MVIGDVAVVVEKESTTTRLALVTAGQDGAVEKSITAHLSRAETLALSAGLKATAPKRK